MEQRDDARRSHTPFQVLLKPDEISLVAEAILDKTVIPPLLVAEMHVTDRCNSACIFCNQRKARQRRAEMSLEFFENIIDEMHNEGLRGIRLSGGGEPTSHPQFSELLAILQCRGISVTNLDTNGLLLSSSLCDDLLACNPRTVHVSLIAPDAELWARETCLPPKLYGTIISNIQRLAKQVERENVRIVLSFVVDEITYASLPRMESLAKELGVEFFIHDLNTFNYTSEFNEKCMPVLLDSISKLSKETLQRRMYIKHLGELEYKRNNIVSTNQAPASFCGTVCLAPWCALMVKADGNMFPCCALVDSVNPLANLRDGSLSSCRSGSSYSKMREEARFLFIDRKANGKLEYLSPLCSGRCGPKMGIYSHPQITERIRLAKIGL